jgi:hypothetical protein
MIKRIVKKLCFTTGLKSSIKACVVLRCITIYYYMSAYLNLELKYRESDTCPYFML